MVCMEKISSFVSLVLALFFFPVFAHAAQLSMAPSQASYSPGDIISVDVLVGTAGAAMNAVSGTVNFPSALLEVASLSKSRSIMSLWVVEPTYSNTAGTVSFEGIVLNPGYTGSAGTIVTINFRVKKEGTANVSFSRGSVLKNDGIGSEILSQMGTATFTLRTGEVPDETGPTTPATASNINLDAAGIPVITSPTHGDSNAWYRTTEGLFMINAPDSEAVRLLIDDDPHTAPVIVYEPPITEKRITDLAEGTWYLHAGSRTVDGWGPTAHFRIQIDTTEPTAPEIVMEEQSDTTSPRVRFVVKANDELSGIKSFTFSLDGSIVYTYEGVDTYTYDTANLSPGTHTLLVTATDRAGNINTATTEFIIDPLDVPVLDSVPNEIREGDDMVVSGVTYPDTEVEVVFVEGERRIVRQGRSDENGNFTLVWSDAVSGLYSWSVTVLHTNGARQSTESRMLAVAEYTFWSLIYDRYLYCMMVVIGLGMLLGMVIYEYEKILRKTRTAERTELSGERLMLRSGVESLVEHLEHDITQLRTRMKRSGSTMADKRQLRKTQEYLKEAKELLSEYMKE